MTPSVRGYTWDCGCGIKVAGDCEGDGVDEADGLCVPPLNDG